MASREKDPAMPHQPLLSSLVVRPSDSDGGGGAGGGSDYEPGEVRRDPPSYSRSDRFADNHGYKMRAGSVSPVRHGTADRRYSPEFDHLSGPPRSNVFGRGRDPPRFRDHSPPYGRVREGGRFNSRGSGPGFGPGPFRGGGMPRNSPNVRPREGDWICSDPRCNNLNFARRESCNNCNRPRYGPGGSPRRGYSGFPVPIARRFPGPSLDRSPGRAIGGYRSPPRSWGRSGAREFGMGAPPPRRREGCFSDDQIRSDQPDYLEDFRDGARFDRPRPLDWGRDRRRDDIMNDRKGYDRRPPSPIAPPALGHPRGHWARDVRGRSRSPVRDLPPLKDYRRDIYIERDRDDRRAMGRDRVGDAY